MFAISLTITTIATWYVHASTQRRDLERFKLAVDHAMGTIEKRLIAYQAMLRSAAGMFAVEERPSKAEFARYFQTTNVREIYPGLQGLGYARYVRTADLDRFVAERRNAGFPDFRVHPPPQGEYFSAIVLLEPLDDRNRTAIGYDMSSDDTRARAMWRSVDDNEPRGTGRVVLVQEIDRTRQNGFLIYQPVFRQDMPIDTPEQRRAALDGWVYSPFRVGDLMRGIFARIDSLGVHMSIYDSPVPDETRLLHSNIIADDYDTRLEPIDHTLNVAGRTWTVRFVPQAAFSDVSARQLVPLVLLGGVGVSLLLTGVTASLSRSRDRANQIAEELRESQAQLRQSELRFRRLVESNLIGVASAASVVLFVIA
ncbi:MAG TPA: CHASE domain-containing protein, partial [Tepidisphaeraceae bacterium]|nr:CHASE domain-containing protein [Tepidisphaeraceae bacterium]